MGQYSFAFLAFTYTFYNGLDGRKPFYYLACCIIWNRFTHGRSGLLYIGTIAHNFMAKILQLQELLERIEKELFLKLFI